MLEASWALVFMTVLLVLVTAWYATEAHRTVRRMDRQREELTRPLLIFQLIPWAPGLLKLRIQNIGGGPAIRIKGTIKTVLNDSVAIVPWSYPSLAVNGYEEFGFPMPQGTKNQERFSLTEIKATVTEVKAIFDYVSVSGGKYSMQENINIQQITSDWAESQMMAAEDHQERILPRIAKALEDLVKKR